MDQQIYAKENSIIQIPRVVISSTNVQMEYHIICHVLLELNGITNYMFVIGQQMLVVQQALHQKKRAVVAAMMILLEAMMVLLEETIAVMVVMLETFAKENNIILIHKAVNISTNVQTGCHITCRVARELNGTTKYTFVIGQQMPDVLQFKLTLDYGTTIGNHNAKHIGPTHDNMPHVSYLA